MDRHGLIENSKIDGEITFNGQICGNLLGYTEYKDIRQKDKITGMTLV